MLLGRCLHACGVVIRQADPQQQAPMHPLGGHGEPEKKIAGAGHCVAGTKMHDPSGRQHAPGHGFGEQVLPGAGVLLVGHTNWLSTTHVPSGRQHATLHGLGVQVGPPMNVPPCARQAASDTRMQNVTPGSSGMQHDPRHGFGMHVAVPGSEVPAGHGPTLMKHTLRSQQACETCGQLLGVHVLPGAGVVPVGQGEASTMHEPS